LKAVNDYCVIKPCRIY